MIGLIASPLAWIAKAIPVWAWLLLAGLAWGGFQHYRARSAVAELHKQELSAAKEREKALQESVNESQRRLRAQNEAIRYANESTKLATADAVAANDAVARLRVSLNAVKARAASANTSAGGRSETERVANVLGSCAERYQYLASRIDAAIIAGQTCQRSYESLRTP